jgi:hypothetical protein
MIRGSITTGGGWRGAAAALPPTEDAQDPVLKVLGPFLQAFHDGLAGVDGRALSTTNGDWLL